MDPIPPPPPSSAGDHSPAHPLEVSTALAAAVEQVLFGFAAKAELETALVVDHGGALVSGISADEDSEIDVVSVLAAGASGAIRALAKRLGEAGEIESFHHGSEQVVYLGGVGKRFLLVGVCRSGTAIGAIREEARQVRPSLASLLAALNETRSDVAKRVAVPAPAPEPLPVAPPPAMPLAGARDGSSSRKAAEGSEEAPRTGTRLQEVVSQITNPAPDPLPTEIIEYLGGDESEIVVEPSPLSLAGIPDSPFEIAEDDEFPESEASHLSELAGDEEDPSVASDDDTAPEGPLFGGNSIFELEEDEDSPGDHQESAPSAEPGLGGESLVETGGSEAAGTVPAEVSAKTSLNPLEMPQSLFELVEDDDLGEPPALGATGLLGDAGFDFSDSAILGFDEEAEQEPYDLAEDDEDDNDEIEDSRPQADESTGPLYRLPDSEFFDDSQIEFETDPEPGAEEDGPEGDSEIDFEAESLEIDADESEDESAVAKGPLYF